MAEQDVEAIRKLLERCSPKERQALFRELRAIHQIHELEDTLGAPAEVILEAIHRAPELTRRMLRGVIADAAFAQSVVPALADHHRAHRSSDRVGRQGDCRRLVRTALDYARAQKFKVMPLCPFTAGFIHRHPEYQNLVLEGYRY